MKLMGSGHTAAVARATSYFSDTSYYNDMTGGIGYYKFLEDCAKNFETKEERDHRRSEACDGSALYKGEHDRQLHSGRRGILLPRNAR